MITIVSGLPRSGTSLMMQMLAAGGMPVLTDGTPPPDVNNPKGYFEWSGVRVLWAGPHALAMAEGKVVKIVSSILHWLRYGHEYQIIFMRRALNEVLASQNAMLRERGKEPALPDEQMTEALRVHLAEVYILLGNYSCLYVDHGELIAEPLLISCRVAQFLYPRMVVNVNAMAACVDSSLYRQRQAAAK